MKIIFCKTAWMKEYKGDVINDPPQYGGKNQDKWECNNFKCVDGKYYGFVEPQHADGEFRNKINIKKIGLSEKINNDKLVDGVLVVWIAKKEKNNLQIVGWYKNATVYSCTRPRDKNLKIVLDEKYAKGSKVSEEYNGMKDLGTDYRKKGNGVNIVADIENCCLLDYRKERNFKQWRYDTYFKTYGHTIWYGKEDEEYLQNLNRLLKKIDDYSNSSNMEKYIDGDYNWLVGEK